LIREDTRESNKKALRVIVMFLSVAIDFFLLYDAITILCERSNWPNYLKYLIPGFLILLEVLVSYFALIRQRDGESDKWIGRNSKYLVLLVIVPLSVLAMVYSIQAYDALVDKVSYTAFITGVLAGQLVFLIPSILLHVWLIIHAEDIAETLAFYTYIFKRNVVVAKIKKMEDINRDKFIPEFTKTCQNLVLKINRFENEYPETPGDFEKIMTVDLIIAINQIMGKPVLKVNFE